MTQPIIYHNPRCSKSREALALLEQRGLKPVIVEYLQHPLSAADIRALLKKLDVPACELLRSKEEESKGVDKTSEEAVIQAIVSHPKLMERPIIIYGEKAIIARPPDRLNSLFS